MLRDLANVAVLAALDDARFGEKLLVQTALHRLHRRHLHKHFAVTIRHIARIKRRTIMRKHV